MTGYESKRAAAQEPVAWVYQCTVDNSEPVLLRKKQNWAESGTGLWVETPLYTTPPQRPWVGLTYEEQRELYKKHEMDGWGHFYNAIESKLKEKNT